MNLTAEQRSAVDADGNVSVVACPGSGKTRTLVARILRTIEQRPITGRTVACITYTNAAVAEIDSRLRGLLPSEHPPYEIETIHSFCLRHIIIPHLWRISHFASGFEVLSSDDARFECLAQDLGATHGVRDCVDGLAQLTRGTGRLPERIPPTLAEEFWARLDANRWVDFSSMIYWSVELLHAFPYIARGLASRFASIVIDEFQDTSDLQCDVLLAIAGHSRTTFFSVGDPHQSIMSVAGANPALMDAFARRTNSRTDLTLVENYRSSSRILQLSDQIISRGVAMIAVGEHRDLPVEPQWHRVQTMTAGLRETFLPLVRGLGIALGNAAILAPRWSSLFPLARVLRQSGTPTVGPGARPYRRSQHILAPLVEELAAYVGGGGAHAMQSVRRELRRLVGTLRDTSTPQLGFAGDVIAMKLAKLLWPHRGSDLRATRFIERLTEQLVSHLLGQNVITQGQAATLRDGARALAAEIVANEHRYKLRETSSLDLGFFARGSESVRLMTIHSSKGREFDAVAVVDLFDGHLPYAGAKPGSDQEAEGRRLLYVAATRARKLLCFFTLRHPQESTQPSRFLNGLLDPQT